MPGQTAPRTLSAAAFCGLIALLATPGASAQVPVGGKQLAVRPAKALTLQQRIDGAGPGSVVLVQPGTYSGPGNRDLDFRGKNITLQSTAGPAQTIIECGSPSDGPPWVRAPHRGFFFHSGESAAAKVIGFTIKYGNGGGDGNGGAISCLGSSPTIRNCVFTENWVGASGGAIYCWGGAPVIEACTFANNASDDGGAIRCHETQAQVLGNSFSYNIANNGGAVQITGVAPGEVIFHGNGVWNNTANQGGGLDCREASVRVEHNDISGNSAAPGNGGAIRSSEADVNILYNQITNNQSYGLGGGIYVAGVANHVYVNLIADNGAALGGGGMACEGAPSMIVNCTFANNVVWFPAGDGAAGFAAIGCAQAPPILNCIFWGNGDSLGNHEQLSYRASEPLHPARCLIEGGYDPGYGWLTISEDPMFVDPGMSDYHLSPFSPAIDQGVDNSGYGILVDLDGNPWHDDADVANFNITGGATFFDIGCYDRQGNSGG